MKMQSDAPGCPWPGGSVGKNFVPTPKGGGVNFLSGKRAWVASLIPSWNGCRRRRIDAPLSNVSSLSQNQ